MQALRHQPLRTLSSLAIPVRKSCVRQATCTSFMEGHLQGTCRGPLQETVPRQAFLNSCEYVPCFSMERFDCRERAEMLYLVNHYISSVVSIPKRVSLHLAHLHEVSYDSVYGELALVLNSVAPK